jgi:hypothetical protein
VSGHDTVLKRVLSADFGLNVTVRGVAGGGDATGPRPGRPGPGPAASREPAATRPGVAPAPPTTPAAPEPAQPEATGDHD